MAFCWSANFMFSYSVFYANLIVYINAGIDLFLHELIFLIGVDDIFDQRFIDSVYHSPQRITVALLLFLFQEFYLHVHEMDLFE